MNLSDFIAHENVDKRIEIERLSDSSVTPTELFCICG